MEVGHSDLLLQGVQVGDINGAVQDLAAVGNGTVDILSPSLLDKPIYLPLIVKNLSLN
jgi:hypothetical protein